MMNNERELKKSPKVPGRSFEFWFAQNDLYPALFLFVSVILVYLPALTNDFVGFDDPLYVTSNFHVQQGITWSSLLYAASSNEAANWHPLTWLSHIIDVELFGLHAYGHHLTSIILHAINTAFLFVILVRMTRSRWQSFTVAALFGWHPLHVESVAWVAERKDVLSALFWMLALWAYARYVEKSRNSGGAELSGVRTGAGWYAMALGFFALGLMSKPMTVTLPLVTLLLDYWPLQRLRSWQPQNSELDRTFPTAPLARLILEKTPFILLAAIGCVLTISAQRQGYSIVSVTGLPITERVTHALTAYTHYLGATFLPRNLAVFYPYQPGSAGSVVLAGSVIA